MTQLVLLKRSDANLVLVTCCDHMEQAMGLAAELSKMQAFSVTVLASLPTLGRFKDEIHEALAALHIQNRWYAAGPGEVLQIASGFFDAKPRLPPAESELENAVASSEPQKGMMAFGAGACAQREACEAVASLPAHAQVIESVACSIYTAAPAATQESSQDEGLERLQGNDESDQSKLLDDGAEAAASKDSQNHGNIGALLVPCDKCEAGAASSITEALRKKLGKEAAAALLKQYKQAVMRDSAGRNTRYWVDGAGQTVKLADGVADGVADSGEAERNWQPNLALEQNYDDLSDASSLDGHESPAHKQVKEYAQSRRAARATLADAQESEGVFFVGPCAKF
jgi:hypothetical protein